MGVVPNRNSLQILKKLVPLNLLSDKDLEQLLQTASFNKDKAGTYLFRQGDTDYHNVYLLSGQVALLDKMREVDRISAGSETSRFPLAHQVPRKNSVRAIGRVEYVRIDNRKLSELLVRASDDDYKVTDLNVNVTDDWMAQLLQSRVFQQIPAANIQGVIMRMEEVEVKRGQNVIEQGGEGDYFYLIHQGRCAVLRRADGEKEPTELAKLGPGDSFGEEALLSDSPRNSTVCMLTKGVLLRLAKEDFIEFVKRPLAKGVNYDEALSQVKNGAVWLDVRRPEDYAKGHIGNSVSLPINTLRYQAPNLAPDQHYVICCDDGQLSATAAFLLTDRGHSVSVLEGGLRSAPADILIKEGNIEAETSAKVISLHSGEEVAEGVSSKASEDLKEKLAAANSRIKELGVRFQNYHNKQQKEEAQRQAELKAQKVILDKTRNRLDELRGKRNADRSKIEQLEKDSSAITESLKAAVEELNQTKGRVTEYTAKLQEEQDRTKTVLKERDVLQEQLDKVLQEQKQLSKSGQEQKKSEENLRRDAEQKLTGLQQELDASTAQLKQSIAEREALEKSIEELRAGQKDIEQKHIDLSDTQQQLVQLREELDATRNKHEGSISDLEQLKQALENANSKIKEEHDSYQQAKVELQELRNAQQHSQSDFKGLEEAKTRAEEELQQERISRQHAETELKRYLAKIPEDGQGEVKDLQDEIATLTESLKEADFAYDEIRERVELLSEEKERSIEVIQELEQNSGAAREEIETLTSELEQLRSSQRNMESTLSDVGESSEEADALREELHLVQMHSNEEIKELKNKLEIARSGLEDREIARGLEKAEEEALRLELDEIRESSRRWEQRLTEADIKCRGLEDAIEDRDEKLDQIKMELDASRVKYEEATRVSQENEKRLNQLRERAEQGLITNEYVDSRLLGSSRVLNLDEVISGPSPKQAMILWFLLGAVICFVLLDGLMLITGRTELITGLLQDKEGSEAKSSVIERDQAFPKLVEPDQSISAEPTEKVDEVEPQWSMLTDIQFGPAMVKLRGGSFIMGSNRNQVSSNEWPAHQVEIKTFAISKTEVTFDEYDRFAQNTGRRLPEDEGWGRGDRPVINVDWEDAVAYTEWLSERTGKKYRLPSEAEWEFSIRSGSDATYWWGYQTEEGRANCFDCGSQWDRKSTAPVGSFPPNNFGLHDMAGNVREWVLDCYNPSYNGAPLDGSAWIYPGCDGRVVRGGTYNKASDSMRSTWRGHFKSDSRLAVIGFRVVREF